MRVFVWLSFSILVLLMSQPARASDAIVTEGVIDATVGAVWRAWTTSEGLRSWLAPHAEIDLRIDGVMRSNYDPKSSLGGSGTIENKILAFVYFQSTSDGKTLLRIVGMGFGTDEESQKMKDYFMRGNAFTLSQLQTYFRR
ncbi:MAG: hypothetical protein EBT59_12590 [Betaproteobacteria bacterium]|nr:hypothetical protein [Betaproteobacteria bacterium]